jgi:hypothetical protein
VAVCGWAAVPMHDDASLTLTCPPHPPPSRPQECLRNVLNKYSLRMHHTTHYVEKMLRELTVVHLQNDQLFKMFPVQSTLTHYGLALSGLTELLAVRV